MPELPEVQTVVNYLKNVILQKEIKNIEIFWSKLLRDIDEKKLNALLVTKKITNIKRIGKYIIFIIEDYCLISHLRMEGKWYFYDSKSNFLKNNISAIINFLDNSKLIFYDTRRFGTLNVCKVNDYLNQPYINKLANDPFTINVSKFYEILKKKNIPIKTALMDQTIISGIGNIYANEILYDVKINPLKSCKDINYDQATIIVNSAKKILTKSIEMGGTTIQSFKSSQNHSGAYQAFLKVHGKQNCLCQICFTNIKKIKINGRGTYFCKTCQK